jgi:membrane protease YdiL (CAAX protease family)
VHRRYGTGSFAADFQLRFRWIDVAFGLVGSIAGRIMTAAASSPIPLPSTRLRDIDQAPAQLTTTGAWVALFVVICIGAPLVEELLFRGLLQPRLVTRFGPVRGIALASALFGAAHLLGWNGPLTFGTAWAIAFGGLALGALRHYTGRLGSSILAHAFFNGQVFLVLYLTR